MDFSQYHNMVCSSDTVGRLACMCCLQNYISGQRRGHDKS